MNKAIKVNRKTASELLPNRGDGGNKGSFGCLLAACGSRDMPGAAYLASMAALRCGVGLLALASVPSVLDIARRSLWEAIYIHLCQTEDGRMTAGSDDVICRFDRASAILVGCGMGRGTEGGRLVRGLLEKSQLPMVIDADGLNCLCDDFPNLSLRKGEVLITPHMGEMSRLIKKDIPYIRENRYQCALDFATQKGVTVVLKDSVTHIASPDGTVYSIERPNSGLAKGGSGDVLAGCIGSFLAQGIEPVKAAILGTSIHSRAGIKTAERMGKYGMLPRDVIDMIPYAIKEMEDGMI